MCGLVGTLLSSRPRSGDELCMISDLFTRLLAGSEHRGPHATGVALVCANGDHYISKSPVPASRFVTSRDYRLVIDKLANDTTLLMGHTRWPTRGSHLDNANNHPLVGDGRKPCIIAHNGHISNHDSLSRLMNLKRDAEVDSEILLRLAERNAGKCGIDPVGLADDISRCRGRLSSVLIATSHPTKILLIKGNQPLEARYHETRELIAYASEPEILDSAIGSDRGWEVIEIPAWRLVVVDTRRMMPLTAYPIPRHSNDEEWRPRPCP
ncbi:MAG: glucosamine 6-phosphate synthetase [Armatimonadetes bacterium]|nr:glucosamine 6-phosphate synthetase [Armatimonadota bacterium]